MNAIQFIQKHGVDRAREVVEGAPSNAESFQDGYYFRTKPEFQFHNGFHQVWNLTDNNGEYFKKRGFNPADLSDLKRIVESVDIITKVGGIHEAIEEHTKWMHAPELHLYRIGESVERLKQAIADYKSIGGEHV